MRFPILDKYDSWTEIVKKFNEEINELERAIQADNQDELINELLDVMQVCIGGLDRLKSEGTKLNPKLLNHYQKLMNRGWNIKGQVELDFINNKRSGSDGKNNNRR